MNQLLEAIEYKARLWTSFHSLCYCNKSINLSNHYFWCIPKNPHQETCITAVSDLEGCFLTNNKHANCLALPFILSNYFCSIWWQAKCLQFVCKKAAWSSDTKTAHILCHARSWITKSSAVVWAWQDHDNFC